MGEGVGASHRGRRHSPRIKGTGVCFAFSCCLLQSIVPHRPADRRKNDVHTIITLTDNAPQGLNSSLSSFPLATKVGISFRTPLALPGMVISIRS